MICHVIDKLNICIKLLYRGTCKEAGEYVYNMTYNYAYDHKLKVLLLSKILPMWAKSQSINLNPVAFISEGDTLSEGGKINKKRMKVWYWVARR